MNNQSNELENGDSLQVNDLNVDNIRKELKGTALQVYLLMAKNKDRDFGVREIQRELDLSTVSLASYHLKRLESMNLIDKTPQSRYRVTKLLPVGTFEDFFVLKGRYLPKEIFHVSFSTSALILSILFLFLRQWGPMILLLFTTGILATVNSWMRFASLWKKRDEEEIERSEF